MSPPGFQLVDSHALLEETCAELAGARRLYLDTEFEGARAGAQLCLLQISLGETIYLIDTLRLSALEPLTSVMSSPMTEWVLHAGAQDVQLIAQRLSVDAPAQVFDTQVAWALVSPEFMVSLTYLQFKLLGLREAKAHQTDSWKRRPLPESQLAYAASDVAHLPELRIKLKERAARLDREQIVLQASREAIWPEPEAPPRLSLDSFRNAWQLDRHSQAGLSFLIDWHNALDPDERRQGPEPKVLLSIANRMPESAAELSRIKGVPRRWSAEHGDHFTGELMRASLEANQDDFVPIDPPPYATFEEIRLDAWLRAVRAEVCAKLEVAPEMALPARVLRRARAAIQDSGNPQALLEQLAGWRRTLVEEAYLSQCEETPPPLTSKGHGREAGAER